MTKPVAVVTGSYQGLGKLIADALERTHHVMRWDIRLEQSVDVASRIELEGATQALLTSRVDVLVNCAGVNRLSAIDDIDGLEWTYHMNVNARSMLYTAQALMDRLSDGGTICNVISNASHMPMRKSLCYNASKAAAAMLTKQMARELWGERGIYVFGVSPNRLHGTPMSEDVDGQVAKLRGWSKEEVRKRQLEALPIGEETDPAMVAEFIAYLLSEKRRHKYLHGAILDYGI